MPLYIVFDVFFFFCFLSVFFCFFSVLSFLFLLLSFFFLSFFSVFFLFVFFLFVFSFFLTLQMVIGGITRDAFTQKVALSGESKFIVSVSVWFSAISRWKPGFCLDCDADSCWLHHADLLVMDGCCQEYLHCTDPRLHGKRVNITFRWIKNNLPQCPVGAGVVCCLPTCARGSHVSASAGIEWSSWGLMVFLLLLVGWGLLVLAALMMAGLWQWRGVVFWLSFWCSVRSSIFFVVSRWVVGGGGGFLVG